MVVCHTKLPLAVTILGGTLLTHMWYNMPVATRGQIKNLTGLKFGRLTPQRLVDKVQGSDQHARWLCVCDCGRTIVKRSNTLRSESACGKCYRPAQDMIDRKFGRLTVLSFSHKNRDIFWNTVCECGTKGVHPTGPMKGGHVKSCGCLAKKRLPDDLPALRKAIAQYKGNAGTRKLDWLLSEDEARELLTAPCAGCGSPPHRKITTNTAEITCNGVDRIDNSKSYVVGNVQTLCKTCNFAKAELSQDEFMSYLDNIRNNSPLKPFYLLRLEDVHGMSGTGVVAVGAILPSGRCVLEWITGELTETIFESIAQIERLHGHNGRTEVVMGTPRTCA